MTDTKDKRREVTAAALSVADAVANGKMSTADLEATAVEQCRELFGTVYGPDDELWDLHVDVVRQGLHAGALTGDELAEWLAMIRLREGKAAAPAVSWIEQALAHGDDEDDEPDHGADELTQVGPWTR